MKKIYTFETFKKQEKMSPEKMLTSDFIKSSRLQLKLTQEKLAECLGVSFATVNRWENGQAQPSKLAKRQLNRFFLEIQQ